MHEFYFVGDPVPFDRATFWRGRVLTSARNRKYKKDILAQWAVQAAEAAAAPLTVQINFYMKRPKTVKREYYSVKPDIDNLCKAVFDALNGSAWVDDAQICRVDASKAYGETPGFVLRIWKL